MMWPPDRVHPASTPAFLSARARILPPWTGMGGLLASDRGFERGHGIKRGRSRRRAETVPGVRSAGDAELDAAVPAPGGLVGALHRGRALAEAHDLEPRARNAEVLEVLARRVGAALAEREVVLLAAALVGVALDDHGPPLAAVLDRARVRLQRRARVRADVVAVVVEV